MVGSTGNPVTAHVYVDGVELTAESGCYVLLNDDDRDFLLSETDWTLSTNVQSAYVHTKSSDVPYRNHLYDSFSDFWQEFAHSSTTHVLATSTFDVKLTSEFRVVQVFASNATLSSASYLGVYAMNVEPDVETNDAVLAVVSTTAGTMNSITSSTDFQVGEDVFVTDNTAVNNYMCLSYANMLIDSPTVYGVSWSPTVVATAVAWLETTYTPH